MPTGHIFWLTPPLPDRDEPGWKTNKVVGLRIISGGRFGESSQFRIITPNEVKVVQLATGNRRVLVAGNIIYTTRLRQNGKKRR